MKKTVLLFLIAIVATQLFAQENFPFYDPKPGDEIYAKRIITAQTGSDGQLYALVELGQHISPQAAKNGPNIDKYNLMSGELLAVASGNILIGAPPSRLYFTSQSSYVPGYPASNLTSYRSNLTYDTTVWLPATKVGGSVAVSEALIVYRFISYRYKYLPFISKWDTYLVKYLTNIGIIQTV